MTSEDTLGYGANANVWFLPSVGVNASIPDANGIPQPWNSKISSVEAGVGIPGFAGTYTATPQQIADFLTKYIFPPAMGPQDELSPFARTLQSGVGEIGRPSQPPVGFLGRRDQDPLAGGMTGWKSSVEGIDPRWPILPMAPQQPAPEPGGLLGLLQDHLRTHGDH